MIFPRKKLILPCHKNGYLQSASDARKWRDRFKRNPLAKVADMFIPRPLRMSPGYPRCCDVELASCDNCIDLQYEITLSGINNGTSDDCGANYCTTCDDYNGTYIVTFSEFIDEFHCLWVYTSDDYYCSSFWKPGGRQLIIHFWIGDGAISVGVRPISLYQAAQYIFFATPITTGCMLDNLELDLTYSEECPCDTTNAQCFVSVA